MTEIIEAIDNYTSDQFSDHNIKLFGFCELMHKSANNVEQVIPVTIPKREQVSLNDKYNLITWIRWAGPTAYELNEEWSFGVTEARVGTIPIRIVFAHKVELGENLVFDFVNNFPNKFTIDGYQFAFVNATPAIDPDHETIYTTELSNTVYEKHRFTWNIYAVNLSVQFLLCE